MQVSYIQDITCAFTASLNGRALVPRPAARLGPLPIAEDREPQEALLRVARPSQPLRRDGIRQGERATQGVHHLSLASAKKVYRQLEEGF